MGKACAACGCRHEFIIIKKTYQILVREYGDMFDCRIIFVLVEPDGVGVIPIVRWDGPGIRRQSAKRVKRAPTERCSRFSHG